MFTFAQKTFVLRKGTLRSLTKLSRSPKKLWFGLKKTFAFHQVTLRLLTKRLRFPKKIWVCSQNCCIHLQNFCVPRETYTFLNYISVLLQANAKFLKGVQYFCEQMQKHSNIILPPISYFFPSACPLCAPYLCGPGDKEIHFRGTQVLKLIMNEIFFLEIISCYLQRRFFYGIRQ